MMHQQLSFRMGSRCFFTMAKVTVQRGPKLARGIKTKKTRTVVGLAMLADGI